jgi:PTS system mannose-specific IIA component
MISVLLISHGAFGLEILKTAESIVGKQEAVFTIELTQEESLETLKARIKDLLENLSEKDGMLILSDMLGGTPCNAALVYSQQYNIEIVSGMNLYMLISALVNRRSMTLGELSNKVIADGKKNITNVKKMFIQNLA